MDIIFRPIVRQLQRIVVATPVLDNSGTHKLALLGVPVGTETSDVDVDGPVSIEYLSAEEMKVRISGDVLVTDQADLVRRILDDAKCGPVSVVDLADLTNMLSSRRNGISASSSEVIAIDHRLREMQVLLRGLLEPLFEGDDVTLDRVIRWCDSAGWQVGDALRVLAETRRRNQQGRITKQQEHVDNNRFGRYRKAVEPLESLESDATIDPAGLRSIFAEGGALSRVIEGFELRSGQLKMSEKVAEAFNDEQQLLVEAGTGTGKGLAYLVPAALYALEHREPVVIATHTIALQDQLRDQDIPFLRAALTGVPRAEELKVETVKGRSNYLCLQRWFAGNRLPPIEPQEARFRARATIWLTVTDSGDRGELSLETDEVEEFQRFAAEAEFCAPSACQFFQRNQCFLYRARRQAQGAHLILTNQALLLSTLEDSGGVLPEFNCLIVDEAHHLEDQATQQLGFNIWPREMEALISRFGKVESTVVTGLVGDSVRWIRRTNSVAQDLVSETSAELNRCNVMITRSLAFRQLWADWLSLVTASTRGEMNPANSPKERTFRITQSVRNSEAWHRIEVGWESIDHRLGEFLADAEWLSQQLGSLDQPEGLRDAVEELQVAIVAWRNATEISRSRLKELVAEPEQNVVYWLAWHGKQVLPILAAAPLQVGEILEERLFRRMRTSILTSATMQSDDSFDFMKKSLGLPDAVSNAFDSPFDYQSSTLLYIADDVPDPRAVGYEEAVANGLIGLASALQGRSLALFTSFATMQRVDDLMREDLNDRGIELLSQGRDGTPHQIVRRLRSNDRILALGAASMWEGIDLPGESLSGLAIVRLPFAVPTDPIFQARAELVDNDFRDLSLPLAVLRFRQGFGRLIRRDTDRGVFVVFDRRIVDKSYGRVFLKGLPGYTLRRGPVALLPQYTERWLGLSAGRGDDS